MLIVCPHCATSYRVQPQSLGEHGRSVRCVGCGGVWFEEGRESAAATHETDAGAINPAALIRPALDDLVEVGFAGERSAPADEAFASSDLAGTDTVSDPVGTESHDAMDAAGLASDASPSIIPDDLEAGRERDAVQDVESFAARRPARKAAKRRRGNVRLSLPAAIASLAVVLGALVAGRHQVVRYLPQTASLYASIGLPVNLRGLSFDNVKTIRDMQDGVPMLVVEGDIVGTTARMTEVPRLRFSVLDRDGKEIYAWTARPDRTLLPPGETLAFRSRLASPPAEASGIIVRFFNRRDAQAGLM